MTISMSNYMEGSYMDVWNAIGVSDFYCLISNSGRYLNMSTR